MNRNISYLFIILCLACSPQQQDRNTSYSGLPIQSFTLENKSVQRIAFGSCAHQDHPQPILKLVQQQNPDLFIYLGDNIYGDTEDMSELKAKYEQLSKKTEFKSLRKRTPILAIWDDHDYGMNDAGKEYPFKKESKAIFLDFWQVPSNSPRRKHEGIFHARIFQHEGKTLQIILLDTRTFRDGLSKNRLHINCKNDYCPDDNPNLNMLGDMQWAWLAQELSRKADLRIIASSNQFSHEYNGWESWTNLPHERERMVQLIAKTKANGVIFISGDVHWGEISKLETSTYPLYDITSSGLTQTWDESESNRNRLGDVVMENNFGLIDIDWGSRKVDLQLIDVEGTVRAKHQVLFDELSIKD